MDSYIAVFIFHDIHGKGLERSSSSPHRVTRGVLPLRETFSRDNVTVIVITYFVFKLNIFVCKSQDVLSCFFFFEQNCTCFLRTV